MSRLLSGDARGPAYLSPESVTTLMQNSENAEMLQALLDYRMWQRAVAASSSVRLAIFDLMICVSTAAPAIVSNVIAVSRGASKKVLLRILKDEPTAEACSESTLCSMLKAFVHVSRTSSELLFGSVPAAAFIDIASDLIPNIQACINKYPHVVVCHLLLPVIGCLPTRIVAINPNRSQEENLQVKRHQDALYSLLAELPIGRDDPGALLAIAECCVFLLLVRDHSPVDSEDRQPCAPATPMETKYVVDILVGRLCECLEELIVILITPPTENSHGKIKIIYISNI